MCMFVKNSIMATIIDNESLGSGAVISDAVVSDPTQMRVQFEVVGASKNDYAIVTYLVNDGTIDAPLTDGNDRIVKNKITENNAMSKNLIYVNSASIKVVVIPSLGHTGSVTVTTKEV